MHDTSMIINEFEIRSVEEERNVHFVGPCVVVPNQSEVGGSACVLLFFKLKLNSEI
jgi:hypothetical protein